MQKDHLTKFKYILEKIYLLVRYLLTTSKTKQISGCFINKKHLLLLYLFQLVTQTSQCKFLKINTKFFE